MRSASDLDPTSVHAWRRVTGGRVSSRDHLICCGRMRRSLSLGSNLLGEDRADRSHRWRRSRRSIQKRLDVYCEPAARTYADADSQLLRARRAVRSEWRRPRSQAVHIGTDRACITSSRRVVDARDPAPAEVTRRDESFNGPRSATQPCRASTITKAPAAPAPVWTEVANS